jgi:serine/threonine protein kinase
MSLSGTTPLLPSLTHFEDSGAASTQVLLSILQDIGAPQYIKNFIDDLINDDFIGPLSKFKPEQIARKYGMPDDLVIAAAFVDKCRTIAGPLSFAAFPGQSLPLSPLDDVSIMRILNFEPIRELGRGGFGIVYEARNPVDKLRVALKIVKDPANAVHAIREGQRLRRVQHKNIVLMHKVHAIENGSCALEMEVVYGGDLSDHLQACRHLPDRRLPHNIVLRITRQLFEALEYLHDVMKWLHGDVKPQNILMGCDPAIFGCSPVDYTRVEIKLADFGLAKIIEQQNSTQSCFLSNATSVVGGIKGTEPYLSPEALQGAFTGGFERTPADDLWSACLVIFEMDTGLALHELMAAPGAVKLEQLLTKASPDILPVLCAVLAPQSADLRCNSAAKLLRLLDASTDPLFVWQRFDCTIQKYAAVHPASSVFLEAAFSAEQPHTMLPLQPPLDLNFDIQLLLSAPTALGFQTERQSGIKCRVRRVLKSSALSSSQSIPIWQELVDAKEWVQCSPAVCAKLDIDSKNPNSVIDTSSYRPIMLRPNSLDPMQLPHMLNIVPYLAPAQADDIATLNKRVQDSLPEWDIAEMVQVVNTTLASKYAAYRHWVAARCNGNPNERMMFHFAHPAVMTKIWQEGEGHDPRLSNWAEVGKGAYFSKHVMYGYAYKYSLWPSPPSFVVKSEPPIGETFQVFASLVCLGNVADMGPGCETCTSLAWETWKKELPILPKPTRPPAMTMPFDTAEKQHILDLTQVKDAPRYDSVISTEGDLGTHPDSSNNDTSGRRICDIMHPRLAARAKEWAEQCVLFDTSASYPMFIVTLTKTRESPMGLQQLIDAGCDANRMKILGFTANHVKALGKTAQQMRASGWTALDMKIAGFSASSLLFGGFTAAQLRVAYFTASQMRDAGCSAKQLLSGGFSLMDMKAASFDIASLRSAECSVSDLRMGGFSASEIKESGFNVQQLLLGGFLLVELKAASFDIASLLASGCSVTDLKSTGFSASSFKIAGCSAQELKLAGFSLDELRGAGFDLDALGHAQFEAHTLRMAGFTALQLQQAGFTPWQLHDGGFSAADLIAYGHTLRTLRDSGYGVSKLIPAGFTALQLQEAGFTLVQLRDGGFCATDLINIGYCLQCLGAAGYTVTELRRAGITKKALRARGYDSDALNDGGFLVWKSFFPLLHSWFKFFSNLFAYCFICCCFMPHVNFSVVHTLRSSSMDAVVGGQWDNKEIWLAATVAAWTSVEVVRYSMYVSTSFLHCVFVTL